jgi:hypothetical protein
MPFTIKVVYDPSVNGAPAGFKATVSAVVHFFETHFTAPITISIGVGYGEINGGRLAAGNLGQSSYNLYSYSYSDITAALAVHATTSADHAALASLPVLSPVNGNFWLSQAQAKALGLLSNTGGLDGSIGIAADSNFTFNRSHGVKAGTYDFFGTVAHEISEVMGRFLLVGGTVGGTPNSYSLLDLFHFSSIGNRDFSGTQPGYFSINDGLTRLGRFNADPNGDFGDWAGSVGNDAFCAFTPPGVLNLISAADLREMDILGWGRSVLTPARAGHSLRYLHHITGAHEGQSAGNAGAPWGPDQAESVSLHHVANPGGGDWLVG